jgi:endonuclease/exonuclease/phosphatase family metal-dependent hydrolase
VTQIDTPSRPATLRPKNKWQIFLLCAIGISIGIAILSDRVPADATVPLELKHPQRCQPLSKKTIRVATFNIRGGEGIDDRVDLDRTAQSLADLDLVALQEVHGAWIDDDGDSASTLGEKLQMGSLFVPTERRWGYDHFGNGLLAKLPLTSLHRIGLPSTQKSKFRNAILSTCELDGRTVRVLTTHIDRVEDHDRQLRAVFDLFVNLQSPAILMGDLNTFPENADLKLLLARPDITAVIGEQETEHRHREYSVDWIICRGLKCVSRDSRDSGASDHPAVCAELELVPQSQ